MTGPADSYVEIHPRLCQITFLFNHTSRRKQLRHPGNPSRLLICLPSFAPKSLEMEVFLYFHQLYVVYNVFGRTCK
ncbi:hypothetical protein Csa_021417 [Cucumis sativus]|uniref:Uncharacterized protein n=1 Tax=Cucumis sativus TaxID=3659 RepID=A0A0A0KQ96_CUCSA|nr:hypothetical protein Csa_021417 [Cucumis sativus]